MTSCIAEVWPAERYTYSYEDLDDELTLMSVDLISSIDGQTMQSCSSEEWWAADIDQRLMSSTESLKYIWARVQ